MGSVSSPSHKCPRIHAWARTRRHVGTRFRSPSAAAKIMNANPITPKTSPQKLPPRAPPPHAARTLHRSLPKPPEPPRTRSPNRAVCGPFSFPRPLPQHLREKYARIHAMRRIVRARINATRLLQMRAQIAGGCFLLHYGLLPPRLFRILRHHLKRMQVDVAVRAIPRAQPAPDTPILDDDLERISSPERSHRAADHAERIAALPAARCHQVLLESQPVAHQPRHAVVRIRAGVHARVAARALWQDQH